MARREVKHTPKTYTDKLNECATWQDVLALGEPDVFQANAHHYGASIEDVPSPTVEEDADLSKVLAFLKKHCTDKQWEAIWMFYVEDVSQSEIGRRLNLSQRAVCYRLDAAEAKLVKLRDHVIAIRPRSKT